jgi:hypothetical protein
MAFTIHNSAGPAMVGVKSLTVTGQDHLRGLHAEA